MSTIFQEIKEKAINLPIELRSELIHDQILSLENPVKTEIETAWDEEIFKRVNEIKSGKASGRPAMEILSEIRAKYS
jgi:hypothetical protein